MYINLCLLKYMYVNLCLLKYMYVKKKKKKKIPPIYLNGVQISIVEHEKHLFNYAPTNISDRNIIANVCDLYQRSNLSISDFRVCDSQTLDCLHKTYCMHMYGFELWNLNCNYVDELRVAGRKIKRRIYYFNMAQRNQFVDDILSDKTSLIHLQQQR